MLPSEFIPEDDCQKLLMQIREIVNDESKFAFERIEDILRLLRQLR